MTGEDTAAGTEGLDSIGEDALDVRNAARPLRLLVVDDHEVVRQGLVSMLERHGQFQVVAQAGSVAEAVTETRRFLPDLVLMDIRLPDGSGIDACREIRSEFPTIPVVFLTSSPEDHDIFSAIVAGANGYVLKQSRATELVRALTAASAGASLLDPGVTGRVLERIRQIATGAFPDASAQLTVQERKILRYSPRATRTSRSPMCCSCPTRRSRTTSAPSSQS